MPTFDEERHIVMIEPLIQANNTGVVHHVQIYACPEEYIFENASWDESQAVCNEWDTNMPSQYCADGRVIFAWAIGGEAVYFPSEAGLPMFQYAFMDVHYDVE